MPTAIAGIVIGTIFVLLTSGFMYKLDNQEKNNKMVIMTLENLEKIEKNIKQIKANADYSYDNDEFYVGQSDACERILDMIAEFKK